MSTQRRERAQALMREPEFFISLCERIAEGGTLLDICREMDLPYGMVFRWIKSDDTRAEAYDESIQARGAFLSDKVISGIVAVSNTTVKDVLDGQGDVKGMDQLSDAAAYAIQSIDVSVDETGTRTKKVKLHDKVKVLEMAGRNQKMFTDKIEHGGQVGLADLVAESMKGGQQAQ